MCYTIPMNARLLPLVTLPNPLLRQKSKLVDGAFLRTDEFKQLLLDMEKTMDDSNGVGLAAVQIGRLIRLTIIKTQNGLLPLINPKIIFKSPLGEVGQEGCLSIPGVWGQVKRSRFIFVRAIDLHGRPTYFSAKGFFARVIQHEVDHMNGILFIDRTKQIDEGKELLDKKFVQ